MRGIAVKNVYHIEIPATLYKLSLIVADGVAAEKGDE